MRVEYVEYKPTNRKGKGDGRRDHSIAIRPGSRISKYLQVKKKLVAEGTIDLRDGMFRGYNNPLDLYIFGMLPTSSNLKAFKQQLVIIWEEYGVEEDENLTIGGQRLKDTIREYVEPIGVNNETER